MSRSLRYQKLTDEEVLELATTKLSDNDRYYLIQELKYRNLRDKDTDKKIEKMREINKAAHNWQIIVHNPAFCFWVYET